MNREQRTGNSEVQKLPPIDNDFIGYFGILPSGLEQPPMNNDDACQCATYYQTLTTPEAEEDRYGAVQFYIQEDAPRLLRLVTRYTQICKHTLLDPEDIMRLCENAVKQTLNTYRADSSVYFSSALNSIFERLIVDALAQRYPYEWGVVGRSQNYIQIRRTMGNNPEEGFFYPDPAYDLTSVELAQQAQSIAECIPPDSKSLGHLVEDPNAIADLLDFFEKPILSWEELDPDKPSPEDTTDDIITNGRELLAKATHRAGKVLPTSLRNELLFQLYYSLPGRGYDSDRILYEIQRMQEVVQIIDGGGVDNDQMKSIIQHGPWTTILKEQWGLIDRYLEINKRNSRICREAIIMAKNITQELGGLGVHELEAYQDRLKERLSQEDFASLSHPDIFLLIFGDGLPNTTFNKAKLSALFNLYPPTISTQIKKIARNLKALYNR